MLRRVLSCLASLQSREAESREAFLLSAGSMAQGLLDFEYERVGADQDSALARLCGQLLRQAGEVFVSDTRSDTVTELQGLLADLSQLLNQRFETHQELTIREPEGFAFYALLPQQYEQAARRFMARIGLTPENVEASARSIQIIGIRSIGTVLAAVAAATLRSSLPIWTVRPSGHPFARDVRIAASLREAVLEDARNRTFVIVDEGPGLSGSSFLALTSFLEQHGVTKHQIWLMPSHDGMPGSFARPEMRERYARSQRVQVSFEDVCLAPQSPLPLGEVFADLVGPAAAPLVDVSAGKWRSQVFSTEAAYPVSHPQQERRKYLMTAGDRRWLLKFDGLGERGMQALKRAHALHAHGFCARTLALRHGFSLTPWLEGARPLSLVACDREALVDRLAAYIVFLARSFGNLPATAGARPRELAAMMHQNAGELLGQELAVETRKVEAWLPELEALHRTTATDNRMEAHEWLMLPDGRVLKTDALNHHAGHDCIGSQDPTWDVVGASFELGLSEAERERLHAQLAKQALWPSDHQWRFYELAYLAFRAGFYRLARTALSSAFPAEVPRLEASLSRYGTALTRALAELVHA